MELFDCSETKTDGKSLSSRELAQLDSPPGFFHSFHGMSLASRIPPFGRRWHSLYLLGGLGEEVLSRPLARRVGHRDYGGPVLGSACNI